MFLFKCIFLWIVSHLTCPCKGSYVYPLWSQQEEPPSQHEGFSEGDASVTEFVVSTFVTPIRDAVCNVCSNFLEVYQCVYFGRQNPQKTPSYQDQLFTLLGFEAQQSDTPQSCSYYSMLVVTITIIIFLGLLLVAKKLVEYVKEEDKVFPQLFCDYKNQCACHQDKE